jgi:hypothetical protein
VGILGRAVTRGVDLVEGGEEGAEVWAAAGLVLGFGGFDVVFDWGLFLVRWFWGLLGWVDWFTFVAGHDGQ